MLIVILLYAVNEITRAELVAEHAYERSESLLVNILPASIAARLKSHPGALIADNYDVASVLFADMAGFTARASETKAADLVQYLNQVFTSFDRLVAQYALEKIKTTGDCYMVVGGVPTIVGKVRPRLWPDLRWTCWRSAAG